MATVKLTGLVAGQTYYFQADGATTDVFGMGAYKLTAQFGGITSAATALGFSSVQALQSSFRVFCAQ